MNSALHLPIAVLTAVLLMAAPKVVGAVADGGPAAGGMVRVMTVNAAHGRKDGLNQLLLGRNSIQSNLRDLGTLLNCSGPDLVALQEADGPSRWSGYFDHVSTVARHGGFPWRFRGDHAQNWLYQYGTALLSHLPLLATHSVRFEPSPPTPRKGFVIGEMAWPAGDDQGAAEPLTVDVVSVHFDFLSPSVRERQLRQLMRALQERSRPRIVLGDFNSEWSAPDSMVRRLVQDAALQAFEPTADDHATYGNRRIDWILISPEFRFHHYVTLPDVVSDHRAVLADIGLRAESPHPSPLVAAPVAHLQTAD